MKSGLSNSILDAIGNTPMLEVEGICKLEYLNPSGSIKAGAKYMIERAEDEGLLRHGDTIVEATSGNTGNALSMVAAVKGYRMLVVPEGMSGERVAISRAFGAEVMEVGHFHVNEALAKAKELGQGSYFLAQFESEWNVEENRIWLGPEILAQLPEGVVPDALVMGVGPGDPHRRRTGFPGGEPCRQALRHGTLGVFDHPVRRGGGPPDRRYLRRLRSWHLRAPQGLVDTALTVDSQEAVERCAASPGIMASSSALRAAPTSSPPGRCASPTPSFRTS